MTMTCQENKKAATITFAKKIRQFDAQPLLPSQTKMSSVADLKPNLKAMQGNAQKEALRFPFNYLIIGLFFLCNNTYPRVQLMDFIDCMVSSVVLLIITDTCGFGQENKKK